MRVRRPTRGPSPADIADRARWEELTATSLTRTQKAAESWRTGLAAFVTLVTGALFLKGPESAAAIENWWLLALTALAASGLGAAVRGLWLGLQAAAGAPSDIDYPTVARDYGGVRQFEVAAARTAAATLERAKQWVAASVVLLGATAFVWWWAPTERTDPPARVTVSLDAATICGTLLSGDKNQLRVQLDGESTPRVIPLADVKNLTITSSC